MASVVAIAAWIVLACFSLTNPASPSGDSTIVINGARTLVACVQDGTFKDCDRRGGVELDAVGPYPPPQYVVAVVAEQVGGAGMDAALRTFAIVSLLAIGALLALMVGAGARVEGGFAAPLLVLCVLTSPLLYYSRSTFGEELATMLLALAAVASLLRVSPWAIAAAVLAAGMTKETAWPFVAVLCGVALWATPIARRNLRRGHWIALGGATIASIAIHAAFDYWRWGTLLNDNYTRDIFKVPGYMLSAKLALSQWLAPNAGLAFFWPLATLLLAGALVIAVLGARRAPRDLARWLPAAAVVGLALVQTGLLARWWAPFGWFAWGPRLSLPLVPALLVVLVACHAASIGAALRWLARVPVRLALATTLLLAVGLPQVTILHHDTSIPTLFQPIGRCAGEPSILSTPGAYYGCLIDRAWRSPPTLVDALGGWNASDTALALLFVYLAGGVALAVVMGWAAARSSAAVT